MSDLGASQIPAMYKAAMRRYEEITKEKLDHREWLKLRTVERLIEEIDSNNCAFDDFRQTRHTLFTILRNVMKPIELAGNLGSGAVTAVFAPSSVVFGAVSYLVNSAKGVSADYDSIQDLMISIKDFTVRLGVYSQEQISEELSDKLTSIFVILMEIFALSRKAMSRGRLLAFGRRIVLNGDDAVQAAVAKLAQLTRMEDSLVGAESLTGIKTVRRTVDAIDATVTSTNVTVHEIGDNMTGISIGIGDVSVGMAEVRKDVRSLMTAFDETRTDVKEQRDESRQERIKRILQPSVSAQDWYTKLDRARVPGTGDWIREEKEFKSWTEKRTPVVWINGIPGSGKSFVSSNMITFLRDCYPQGVRHPSNTSIGYFFFKHDNPDARSFHRALCDMSYQISQNDPLYAKDIDANCSSPEDISTLESAWRELFVKSCTQKEHVHGSTFLILDGIDEAYESELQDFLELVNDLYKDSNQRLFLAMVGRPQLSDNISETLGAHVPTIHVTEEKNSADIAQYIKTSIQKSNVLKKVSQSLRAEIVEKLLSGARGMFLWVDLIMRELMKSRGGSESGIRKKLGEAPKGLKKMFCHVLEGYSSTCGVEESEKLNEILAWTTCAARPLKLIELDAILKFMSPEGDGIIDLEGALRVQFASFFYLAREDGRTTADIQTHGSNFELDDIPGQQNNPVEGFEDVENETDFNSDRETTEVTFCHASIGDFFRNDSQEMLSAGDGHSLVGVKYNDAKINVLIKCLKLLCDENLRATESGRDMRKYAFTNWQHHLDQVELSQISMVDKILIASFLVKMFSRQSVAGNWIGSKGSVWFNHKTLQCIRRWFAEKAVVDSLPLEDQEWIDTTSKDPIKTFFQPINRIAKGWLEETGLWKPWNACRIIYTYINLEKGTPFDESFSGLDTAEGIVLVAKWPKLAETAIWHTNVAFALLEKGLLEMALIYFGKAVKLDPTMWTARAEMGKLYNRQFQMEQTLELDTESEKQLIKESMAESDASEEAKAALHEVQERMGATYLVLGDTSTAFDISQRALSNDPICDSCMLLALSVLLEDERWSEIIDIFKTLATKTAADIDHPLLFIYLAKNEESDSDRIFLKAAFKTGELKFLVESYRNATQLARTTLGAVRECHLGISLARLYYSYMFDEHRAVHIWEKILKMYSASKEGSDMSQKRLEASGLLADHWFRKAVDAGIHSREAEICIKKLEILAKPKSQVMVNSTGNPVARFPAILLGQWDRLSGRMDNARDYFRPSIMTALQILSDDDPDNDQDGFKWLAAVLLAAGDYKNCVAACHAFAKDAYTVLLISEQFRTRKMGKGDKPRLTIEELIQDVTIGAAANPSEAHQVQKAGSVVQDSIEETTDGTVNDLSSVHQDRQTGSNIKDLATNTTDGIAADPPEANPARNLDQDDKIELQLKLGMIQASEALDLACDGPCDRTLPGLTTGTKASSSTSFEYYRCHYCLAIGFCGDCLQLLKEGNMPFNICSSKHEWLVIPMPSKVAEEGKMLVDGEIVDFEDWKKGLKEEWSR